VLATDLLVGVLIGVGVKLLVHLVNGLPLTSMFKPFLEIHDLGDQTVQIDARGSAVFSNWIPFRGQIERLGLREGNHVIVNFAGTKLVDHSVLEKLHELEDDFRRVGLRLEIQGLDDHRALSGHQFATRTRRA
jgi:MFS superfamily sulfate permease-like transporter